MSGTDRPQATCPRCGYDLRGETSRWDTRCPLQGLCSECGLEFDWRDVLSPRYRLDEPHVELLRLGSIRGIMASFRLAFVPTRLWRRVTIESPVVPRRLGMFFVGGAALSSITWCGIGFLLGLFGNMKAGVGAVTAARWALELLGENANGLIRNPVVLCAVLLALWSAGVLLLARASHQSFRSARFRTAHILRLQVYAAVPVMVITAVVTHSHLILESFGFTPWPGLIGFSVLTWIWWYIMPPALLLWYILVLWLGFTRYLKLPRPLLLLMLTGALIAVPVAGPIALIFFAGWKNGWVL